MEIDPPPPTEAAAGEDLRGVQPTEVPEETQDSSLETLMVVMPEKQNCTGQSQGRVMPPKKTKRGVSKAQGSRLTISRKGENRRSLVPAKVEPLPRRETGEGTGEVPKDCSPPIDGEHPHGNGSGGAV